MTILHISHRLRLKASGYIKVAARRCAKVNQSGRYHAP